MKINKNAINSILLSNFLKLVLVTAGAVLALSLLDNGDAFNSIYLSMPTSFKSFSIYPLSWYVIAMLVADIWYVYIALLIFKKIVKKNEYKSTWKSSLAVVVFVLAWLVGTITVAYIIYDLRKKANYETSWADLLNIYYTLAIFAIFFIVFFIIVLLIESIINKIKIAIEDKKGFAKNTINKTFRFFKRSKGKQVFPKLKAIDKKYEDYQEEFGYQEVKLNELCEDFCEFLWKRKRFYTRPSVQAFLSAILNTRYVILRGKTADVNCHDLPLLFAKFINADSTAIDVLPTWREERDLIGFYNDYTKAYNATAFLQSIYRSTFKTNTINLIVFDEMNNARVEKYFAGLIGQIDSEKKLVNLQVENIADKEWPVNAPYGQIECLDNNWFIGVEVRDDSKYRIPEKILGLAYVVDIRVDNSLKCTRDVYPENINYLSFMNAKKHAYENIELDKEDIDFIDKLCEFLNEHFVALNKNAREDKYKNFLKMYYACGGEKTVGINKNLYALLTTYLDDSSISVKKEDLEYLKSRLIIREEKYQLKESIDMVDTMIKSMGK